MQDLAVQIQSIPVKPDDIIILTFSKDIDIDECNQSFKNIKEMFPNLHFIPNREDIIKNITVLDMQIPYIAFDETTTYSYEEVSNRAW